MYFVNLSIKVPAKFKKRTWTPLEFLDAQFQNVRISLEKVHLSQLTYCILARVWSSNIFLIIMNHPVCANVSEYQFIEVPTQLKIDQYGPRRALEGFFFGKVPLKSVSKGPFQYPFGVPWRTKISKNCLTIVKWA